MHYDLLTMYTAPDGGQCSTTHRLTNCDGFESAVSLFAEFLQVRESSPERLPTHGEEIPKELESTGMTAWWEFAAWAEHAREVSVKCQNDTMVHTNRRGRPDIALDYNETFPIEQAMQREAKSATL